MKALYTILLTLKRVCWVLLLWWPFSASATHNRAGEIHIEQIGPLTIRATIVTWTKTSSFTVDRDTLTICWGDGTCESVPRSNGNGIPLPNDVKFNTYVAIHTYAGQATYSISMTDQNRNGGIINVNPPSSDLVPFHVATSYTFQDIQFGGQNTTPYLLQPPVDNACLGKIFTHNPNAYDPDGDSLAYRFIVPLQLPGQQVPNYSYPNQINPGADNLLQLNPVTGDLIWASPQTAGEYNVAIAIISWRNGVPIDTTIRDMQILVTNCNNNPPSVTATDEICVVAGQIVRFPVVATDPDSTDYVRLTALGSPLVSPYSPAVFTGTTGWVRPPVNNEFFWQTACEHISDQPYSVVFKATDSVNVTAPKLSALKSVSIKVVGPAPEDLQADAGSGVVELSWAKPFICETTGNNNFYGFSVWRREGSNPFMPDSCAPGLAGKGYTELIYVTRAEKDGRYYFKDTGVQQGRTYCYRVLAKFARQSAGGFPYNIVEGLASDEICTQLPRNVPVITHASVESTDVVAGAVRVCWSKPVAADLDTLSNPGPYRYELLRGDGLSGGNMAPVPGGTFVTQQFWQANDTCFTDTGLNTEAGPYHYAVAFYVNNNAMPMGVTNEASTVRLSIAATDRRNRLSWQEMVPWANRMYRIFRENTLSGQFDLIGSTSMPQYEDAGLTNGVNYCYKVLAEGTYGVGGIITPLLNWSQEACGTPIDTVPPCIPVLTVTNSCTTGEPVTAPDPPFENQLSWTNPDLACPDNDGTVAYHIWFKPDEGADWALLHTVEGADQLSWIHESLDNLAGCYAVSALDNKANESRRSTTVCTVNCANYSLPNAFTPNGDQRNDVFQPFPGWRFVEKVDMQIYNRWGNLVFSTADPAINWTGADHNGQQVADGAYFYVCKVYETGNTSIRTLSGWIEVLAGE